MGDFGYFAGQLSEALDDYAAAEAAAEAAQHEEDLQAAAAEDDRLFVSEMLTRVRWGKGNERTDALQALADVEYAMLPRERDDYYRLLAETTPPGEPEPLVVYFPEPEPEPAPEPEPLVAVASTITAEELCIAFDEVGALYEMAEDLDPELFAELAEPLYTTLVDGLDATTQWDAFVEDAWQTLDNIGAFVHGEHRGLGFDWTTPRDDDYVPDLEGGHVLRGIFESEEEAQAFAAEIGAHVFTIRKTEEGFELWDTGSP